MTARYVALGSSMAAGPGIAPGAPGAPKRSGRSAVNYPHLVADRLGYHLVDVTFSGATTAHVLFERQFGASPQVHALDGSESLVTITIGGNDAGYVPMLGAACLPRFLRSVPVAGGLLHGLLDPTAREQSLEVVGESLKTVGREVRRRAPAARVLFVDYLTLLPPAGVPAPPIGSADADLGRHIAARLAELTAVAAADTGCELVPVAEASRDHHAWSADPWTTAFHLPLPGRVAPLHPNAAGMRAVAQMVIERVSCA